VREDSSSESKHDDGSPRTSSNPNLRLALDRHHLLSVGDGSVSRTHRVLLMRQLLMPLSYPAVVSAPTRSRTSRLRHRKPVLCPAELWTRVMMGKPRPGSNRSTSPMSCTASASPARARYRLTPRGNGGERDSDSRTGRVRQPTWIATRPLQPDSLQVSLRGEGSASRTLMPAQPADLLDVSEALCR
jgi:hypothetical protein